jgi:hypothetical protein
LPDSYGKRRRDQVKARKATAREERRVARNQRRAAGSVDEHEAADRPEETDNEGAAADPQDDSQSDQNV